MNKTRLLGAVFLVLLTTSGCSSIHGTLYPANDLAEIDGVLEAKITAAVSGTTPIVIPMPSRNETLTGSITIMKAPPSGFGEILGEVNAAGVVSTTGQIVAVATLLGDKGTRMKCEMIWGVGGGACKSSEGGLYRLDF